MKISSPKGFTLTELLVAVFIIGVALTGIMFAVNQSQRYVEATKWETIASNLAKEGMEGIYHLRNTNRAMYPEYSNSCRLKQHPLTSGPKDMCINDPWLQEGNYLLMYGFTGDSLYIYLSGAITNGLDLSDGIQSGDLVYSICYTNKRFVPCPGTESEQSIKFFRIIKGGGLYGKQSLTIGGDSLTCMNGSDGTCGDESAKEYRFCSKVAYIGSQEGEVELCGVITNFK